MTMRAKDPERRSRLLRAAAASALFSGFVGALIVFSWYQGGNRGWLKSPELTMIAATAIMMMFWMLFIPLYIFTVHKSRKTVEFEHQARLEEQRRAERTREALKSGGASREGR
jgi:hypothetical protein